MSSYFTVETLKIIGPCQEAIENIRKHRIGRKTRVLEKLVADKKSSFWIDHPWRHFVRRQKPEYDVAKLLACDQARMAFFQGAGIFSSMEYSLACSSKDEAEEVCEKLLAAGKMCRDITITIDDWMMVSKWAKQ